MTEVDPLDDSITRYVIRRHRFDPATNHFRWFNESAFDNKTEFEARLQQAFEELAARSLHGNVEEKEQISGQKLSVNYLSESSARRKQRKIDGAYLPVNWKNKILFQFHFRRSVPSQIWRKY